MEARLPAKFVVICYSGHRRHTSERRGDLQGTFYVVWDVEI